MYISVDTLWDASKLNPAGVLRLAKWLGLDIDDQSDIEQVARLINWKISKPISNLTMKSSWR